MSGLVKGVETWLVPVKLQQLYKGYSLSEVTLADIVMPHTFLASLARLADVIYKTGTVPATAHPAPSRTRTSRPRSARSPEITAFCKV